MKIAVLLPIYRSARWQFVDSLAKMLVFSSRLSINFRGVAGPPEIEVFTASGALIAYSRNYLADQALKWGADGLLWLDDDHVFPADALARLLRHDKPIMAANYVRRQEGGAPTAEKNGEPVWTTKEKAEAGACEEVHLVGMGVCFMVADALRKIEAPYFGGDYEDVYLCNKLRAAGVPLYIDHALSWASSHIGEHGFGFQSR
ncbi:hypothetical protein E2493_06220 [Sphingomonas parva]|uniref:Glycosyltransferase family 2 protein n=1 Tax=Sphingomonas parva TaxID=2555898 RepID=A0A4Y8ZUH2_9SPHN|nr:hypothetical protein [Sphingomonas parva]TFI59117.1 hypothetical protein E2493_06220 [Sphingomonas parva]